MPQHRSHIIANLPTTHGRVSVRAVWRLTTYVLCLSGPTDALRALLIEVRPVLASAKTITFRPEVPITTIDGLEPFFDATSARWRVLRSGPFSEFAPGLPAQPLPTEHPPCPAAP